MSGRWPFPEDTQRERDRKIAQAYRAALLDTDPARCRELDERAQELGQGWVAPKLSTMDLDEELRAVDLEELVGIPAATIRKWASRGLIEQRTRADGAPVYLVREVVDHCAEARRRRAGRASTGQQAM